MQFAMKDNIVAADAQVSTEYKASAVAIFINNYIYICLCWSPGSLSCRNAEQRLDFNTLRPRKSGRHFADNIFKCISLNDKVWIPIKISLTFVPKGPINNTAALVKIMAWRQPDGKPLSQPMMVS